MCLSSAWEPVPGNGNMEVEGHMAKVLTPSVSRTSGQAPHLDRTISD